MSDYAQKISWDNTRFAGLTQALAWLKRERFWRYLNHISLDLKTVKRSPRQKLEDLVVCLMTGVSSIRQIDEGVRKDEGLALALGRDSLADQSLLSRTLDAFDEHALARLGPTSSPSWLKRAERWRVSRRERKRSWIWI